MPDAPVLIFDVGDKQQKGLLVSFDSRETTDLMRMVKDTGLTRRFRFAQDSATLDRPYDEYPVDTATIEWAVGLPDQAPTAGNYTLLYPSTGGSGSSISGITPGISATVLAALFNANTNITSAGGVSIVAVGPTEYEITFTTVGNKSDIGLSAGSNTLFPSATVDVQTIVQGDASTHEVQLLRVAQNPMAYTAAFVPSAAGTATVSTVRAGTSELREIQRVTLSPGAYGGAFNLTFKLPETTLIGACANVGSPGTLAGKYFLIHDKDGPVAVWFFVSTETQPNTGDFNRAIQVTIAANDTASTVGTAIKTALDADAEFVATNVGSAVTVTDASSGLRTAATAGNATGITVTRKQAGLSISAPIPYNASPEAVEAEMGAAFTVAKPSANQWDFTSVILGDMPAMTVDDAGLLFPIYYTATLRLNALTLHDAFGLTTDDEITVTMEVRVTQPGEDPLVVYNGDVVVARNLIELDSIGSIPWDAVQPIKAFSTTASLVAATPDFVGQIAWALDTAFPYWGNTLTAGGFNASWNFSAFTVDAGIAGIFTVTGSLIVSKTMTAAGTTGAQTINKIAGRVNIAAGQLTLAVTNSLVTTSSVVLVCFGKNDATAAGLSAVTAAGGFTIHLVTAPTAETRVDFLVLN